MCARSSATKAKPPFDLGGDGLERRWLLDRERGEILSRITLDAGQKIVFLPSLGERSKASERSQS